MKPPPARYAAGTDVPVERSRAALDTLLGKHGATSRAIGESNEPGQPRFAVVHFRMASNSFKLRVPLETPGSIRRRDTRSIAAREREQWRLILLLVKAKLEAVRLGVSTAEREFMPDLVTNDGRTLYERLGGSEGRQLLLMGAGPAAEGSR